MFIKTILLPLALIIIMFGMGMSLSFRDFKRVFISPKAKLLGLFCQIILLPLVALGLISLFGLTGELAVGVMLIAACPGGATSNLITHLAKGDTALSVSLTAVSSLITIVTIPLIIENALSHFMGSASELHLSFLKTVIQLMVVILIPICLGMVLHSRKPALCKKLEKTVKGFSMFFLILVIVIAVSKEENLLSQLRVAGPVAFSLNVITMSLGFGLAWLLGLKTPQRITLAVESGIQNGTLALAISLGMLDNAHISMPAVAYSLIMFGTGGLMILFFGRPTSIRPAPLNS